LRPRSGRGNVVMAWLTKSPTGDCTSNLGAAAAIERELVRDGFVDRYHTDTGVHCLPSAEGVFFCVHCG
jgi:hypothetical protein